ncbi:hypothetical protein L596_024210 [Steinernema carpocapsae]|uniref:Uncharacterized protein n=1 Tax=Steinernema carpocapsae TaxID=34508 RepID=A0A4V5ZZN1_STECR|nr:hypothetical protein L596_024210 [Steinernema carpocapsae]
MSNWLLGTSIISQSAAPVGSISTPISLIHGIPELFSRSESDPDVEKEFSPVVLDIHSNTLSIHSSFSVQW